jgi:uncharacterized protein (TIGR03067 family)
MTMFARIAFGFLLVATTVQPQMQPQPSKAVRDEMNRLQGSWTVEMQEENGEKLSAEDLKGRTVMFGKDAIFVRRNGNVSEVMVLKFDPAKSPKTVNALVVEGEHKGDIMPGIYALDGDSLKVCFDRDGQERPKEFTTAPKSGHFFMVCKRIRAKGEDQDLSGLYQSQLAEKDGTKVTMEATIERVGDSYLVAYKKGGALVFVAVGLRKGDTFCTSWTSNGQLGVGMYQIEKGPRLVGHYTVLGGPGVLVPETLIHKGGGV